MDLARCFELVGDVAVARGVTSRPDLGHVERTAVLDLARVVAHSVERSAAPLACYALGQVVAGADESERLDLLHELIERIEAETRVESPEG